MSQDRLTAFRLLSYYWLTIIMPPNILAYNVVYNRESSSTPFQSSAFYQGSGRKFGGYRIVPKACKDETATSYRNDAPTAGVCMFNYECTQLGGAVVGSCVDVFLFGACCRLPAGVKVPAVVEHGGGGGGVSTTAAATTADGPPRDTLTPVSFQQPVADTILYHRNGTAVQNTYRPDDMSADLLANFTALLQHQQQHQQHQQHQQQRPPAAGDYLTDNVAVVHVHHQQGGYDRRPPFSSGANVVNGNKFASKVDFGGGSTFAKPTPPRLSSSSPSSPVSKSTDSVPNVRKTTPSSSAVQATTSKQGYGGGHSDDYYDNMVLIPTLTVHDPNVKAPPAVENNSIHHILSILNHTPGAHGPGTGAPDSADGDSMDSPSSASYAYAHPSSTHPPASSSSSPALYTWGSIETADSKSPGYGSSSSSPSSTFPATRPTSYYTQQQQQHYYGSTPTSTSTHHLPGPHFHVSTTARPVDPVVPTVIVLSPANDPKHPPNKYGTSTSTTTTTTVASYAAHRPPPSSHVKPSQSIIVTGKPSVSAAYTTTATYHHSQQQQQQQQDIAFVPVSSTTLADKYYNTNNNNNNNNYHQAAVHTSAKPLVSSAKPAHTTYGAHRPPTTASPPPTLSSTVHNDNNNVFTTVITSVNHQYHGGGNKYQPTATTATPTATYSTTARPVVNDAGTAAVLQPTTSYRPPSHHHHHYPTDDDYPSVTPPASQVFITASEAAAAQYAQQHHHHHQQQQQQQAHYPLQQHTSSSAYPVAAADDYGTQHPFNITDTFAFPPVRDPYVNLTAATQQERPPDVTVVDGGDYDSDADPNPQLTADEHLDDKVHLFVEKVVQSLQGNFEDLERVLLSGDAAPNVTIGSEDAAPSASTTGWPPNKKKPAAAGTTTTKRPPTSSSKPGNKPAKPAKPASSTYRPTPITPPADAPYLELQTTARPPPPPPPTKVPTLLTPVQLFQPTGATYGGAQDNKRPTKQPTRVPVSTTTVVLDTLNVEHDHTTAEPDYRKTCGVRPLVRKNGRIVGGTGSTFGEWPWQVLVREATWLGLFTKNKCGGVLITQRHVITAAHCQPGFLANLVAVFGEYDISGEVESKRSVSKNVKRVIVHRQYDAATFENDIALLELESPVAYDTHIVPICMPDDEDDFTGRMAVVTGWGRLKYGGGVPSILQEVQVPIIENQVCQDMFETAGHTKTILSSFLCAGYANGQRDSCEGDSGGPLMIEKDNGRWTLIGTVSHGIKCAAPYLPGVYMRTTYYKPWLQTITGVQ